MTPTDNATSSSIRWSGSLSSLLDHIVRRDSGVRLYMKGSKIEPTMIGLLGVLMRMGRREMDGDSNVSLEVSSGPTLPFHLDQSL